MKILPYTLTAAALTALLVSAARPTAPALPVAAETYAVDNAHSFVVFHTKHIGISEAYGRFDTLADKSQVVLDADPAKSSILLVVMADSVNTNNADRDKHLRSGDFFGAKEFPEIVFESKKIENAGQDWLVTGDLTFHGVTKPVTANARQIGKGDTMFKDYRAGFHAELTVNMADFGIEFAKKNPGAVGPEVHLAISLECIRK